MNYSTENRYSAQVVSCPASFHSHTEEKSLVKCLFNFCSVNYDVMLVVYDVFNVAMCTNDLMFAHWQVTMRLTALQLCFHYHTQTMGYFVNRQLDFPPYINEWPSFMEQFEKHGVLHDSFCERDDVIHVLQCHCKNSRGTSTIYGYLSCNIHAQKSFCLHFSCNHLKIDNCVNFSSHCLENSVIASLAGEGILAVLITKVEQVLCN